MTDPLIAQPVRETLVVHEPDPLVLVELARTTLELTLDGQRVVYFVEPTTGTAVDADAFAALVARVAVLEAKVAALEAAGPLYPGLSLLPSPTLYPEAA